MTAQSPKEEFVGMLTALMSRCKEGGSPIAYRRREDVGSDDMSTWGSMAYNIHGKIYVDDDDIEPTREDGKTWTPMFGLHEIDDWPEGLFEKLSSYTWWLDPDEEIPVLDVLAGTPRDEFQV